MLKLFLLAQLGAFILSPNAPHTTIQEQGRSSKEIGTATITAAMLVTLPDSKPLNSVYKADITPLNLADEASAVKHFGYFNDNIVRCRVDYKEKLVYIGLDVANPNTQGWGVKEWNEHFKKKASWWAPAK